jgi:hypothetical protein
VGNSSVEDQLPDVAEFERAFGVQCQESLKEVLGASGFASTAHYFIEHALSFSDSAVRPAEFDDALSVLFNPVGAVLLETRILKRFYHSIGMKFEWNEGRVFKEEVEEALQQFRKRAPQPSSRSQEV